MNKQCSVCDFRIFYAQKAHRWQNQHMKHTHGNLCRLIKPLVRFFIILSMKDHTGDRELTEMPTDIMRDQFKLSTCAIEKKANSS
jgi:hypothetical protein